VRTWAREAIDDGIPRRTIMFTMTVGQAHAMASAFSQAGYPAAAIDASTPAADRRRILDQFARGELVVLTNCASGAAALEPMDCCGICGEPGNLTPFDRRPPRGVASSGIVPGRKGSVGTAIGRADEG
jgi:hypothetical protein